MFNMHRKKGTQQHPPEMKAKFTIFFLLLFDFVRPLFFPSSSFYFFLVWREGWMRVGYDIFLNLFFFEHCPGCRCHLYNGKMVGPAPFSYSVSRFSLFFFLLLLCPCLETYNEITQRYTALSSSISFPIDWTDGIIRNVGKYEMRKLNLLFIFLFRLSCWSHHFSFLVWVPLNERSCNV